MSRSQIRLTVPACCAPPPVSTELGTGSGMVRRDLSPSRLDGAGGPTGPAGRPQSPPRWAAHRDGHGYQRRLPAARAGDPMGSRSWDGRCRSSRGPAPPGLRASVPSAHRATIHHQRCPARSRHTIEAQRGVARPRAGTQLRPSGVPPSPRLARRTGSDGILKSGGYGVRRGLCSNLLSRRTQKKRAMCDRRHKQPAL